MAGKYSSVAMDATSRKFSNQTNRTRAFPVLTFVAGVVPTHQVLCKHPRHGVRLESSDHLSAPVKKSVNLSQGIRLTRSYRSTCPAPGTM